MKTIKLFAFCFAVCILFTGCTPFSGLDLMLERILVDDSYYCYNGLTWASTEDQARAAFPFELGEPDTGIVNPETPYSFEHAIYIPKSKVRIHNKEGRMKFQFRDGMLTDILFSFEGEPKEVKKLNDTLLAELSALYSDKFEESEHVNGTSLRVTREWTLPFGNDRISRLQLLTYSRHGVLKSIAISVFCPNPKYYMKTE